MDELERDAMVVRWTRHHGLRIPYRKWWGGRGFYEPDFLVELVGGGKELREVKGEHLFKDMNTARKIRAGDRFCRDRGMIFRLVTKSGVDPESWGPNETIEITDAPADSRIPLAAGEPRRRSVSVATVVALAVLVVLAFLWLV